MCMVRLYVLGMTHICFHGRESSVIGMKIGGHVCISFCFVLVYVLFPVVSVGAHCKYLICRWQCLHTQARFCRSSLCLQIYNIIFGDVAYFDLRIVSCWSLGAINTFHCLLLCLCVLVCL